MDRLEPGAAAISVLCGDSALALTISIEPPSSSNIEMLVENFPQLMEWPQGSFTYLDRKKPMFYLTGSAQIVSDRDQVLAERLW